MGVEREERVVVDIRREEFEPRSTVVVRQHDKGARILAEVRDGGVAASLASEPGLSAYIMCNTRGGLVEHATPVSGSVCEYVLGQDMTARPGELLPYIELRRGGEVIAATSAFRLVVTPGADLTAAQAEEEGSRLDAALDAWRAFDAEARATEEERRAAEIARAEAERGRADEWASAGMSVGDVSSSDAGGAAGASIREGPGGRLDLVLDLTLPRGEAGPQGPQGPKGDDGGAAAIVGLDPGLFSMYVSADGHLMLAANDNDPVPPLSIKGGRLVYTID